jgi:hypothetical protein
MVTLSSFVLVTHDADTINHIGKPIFQIMLATLDGARRPPDDEFHKRPLVEHKTFREEGLGVHVVNSTNTRGVLSIYTTGSRPPGRRCHFWIESPGIPDQGAVYPTTNRIAGHGR